ncbi:unnamed protein product [Ilex paraguariensis]|uniref:Uncharacterized protein n=1 Tax=Ilex paraguariensis TaxID=185542 RepID=A0ABC8UD64_9AQUA
MADMSCNYKRVGRRCHGMRGFRLKYPRRFSVQRLRKKFLFLFRVCSRWRFSLRSWTRSTCRSRSDINGGSSRRNFVAQEVEVPNMYQYHIDYRLKSFGRSNSFYSEAISDCLEFIKRSSISVDDIDKPVNQR